MNFISYHQLVNCQYQVDSEALFSFQFSSEGEVSHFRRTHFKGTLEQLLRCNGNIVHFIAEVQTV